MLPLWAILSPLGDSQRMKGQATAVFLSHSLFPTVLFHCCFLICSFCSSRAFHGPFGRDLLQHGLTNAPQISPALAVVAVPSFSAHGALFQAHPTGVPPGWLKGSAEPWAGWDLGAEHRAAPASAHRAHPKASPSKTLAGAPNTTVKYKEQTKDLKYLEKGFCK